MNPTTEKIGALAPELGALADWLDQRHFTVTAEAVRDWHPERDGAWRPYGAHLARLSEVQGDAPRAMARTLLRASRGFIARFFGTQLVQAGSNAILSNSARTKSVSTV